MKKTLFLTLEYPPFRGGVGRFAALLFRLMPKEKRLLGVPRGFQATWDDSPYELPLFFKSFWPKWIRGIFALRSFVKKHSVEQTILFHVLPLGTMAYVNNVFFDTPYIVVIHGLDLAIADTFWKKLLIKRILSRSSAIVTISEYTRKLMLEFGMHRSKIVVIPPGAYLTPSKNSGDLNVHDPILLTVGRLVKRKNFDTILDCAKKLKESNLHVLWKIVGSGPEEGRLRKRVNLEKIDNIEILTDVGDEQLRNFYSSCSAVVFIPLTDSKDVEGFGISAAEGAAFGKPVIASNRGGVLEIIKDTITGFLVDPLNADDVVGRIKKLLSDQSKALSMGTAAAKHYKESYAKEAIFEKLSLLTLPEKNASISVVIPVYNGSTVIGECIRSIFNQSLKPQEIIIVDDCSSDTTCDIVEGLKRPDLMLLRQKENKGAPAARNIGASVAKSDYIIFVDADMRLNNDMLEKMYRALRSNNVDFVYSRFYFGWKAFPSFEFDPKLLYKHNYIHTSSLLRKKDFPGFDETLTRHQDWDLWLQMVKNGKKAMLIPEYLYSIKVGKQRISSWVPSFAYSLPFINKTRRISSYETSADIIRKKHSIPKIYGRK